MGKANAGRELTGPELTGKGVLAITLGAFGIIIAVNLVMATQAVRSFPGLEVANSYVASQTFDADRRAQAALGWDLAADYAPGRLALTFRDAQGLPAPVQGLEVLVGRTTEARDDTHPAFARDGGQFAAPVTLAPGKWLLRVQATAADGTVFQQRLSLRVRG